MTVQKSLLECEVCGRYTRLRTQIGNSTTIPIRVYCRNCGILMSGELFVEINGEEIKFDFQLVNAIIHSGNENIKPDYYIEASSEYITEKLKVYEGDDDIENRAHFSPYFYSIEKMGGNNITIFQHKLNDFLKRAKNDWQKVRRVNELWFNKKNEYIESELLEYFNGTNFKIKNRLECLVAIYDFNFDFFYDILNEEKYNEIRQILIKNNFEFASHVPKEFMELVNSFGDDNLLEKYNEKIFTQIKQFMDKYSYLIPAWGMQYYTELDDSLYLTKGLTTASFEDIKDFYIDTYEVIMETVDLIIAFNNLKYRNDYKKMISKRRDVINIEDFMNLSKGDKLKYLCGIEEYDKLIFPNLDNKIRNAIGHNSYKYDGVTQTIYYESKGMLDLDKASEISLLEFAHKCWTLFLCIMNISDLVYKTEILYYLNKGLTLSCFKDIER